MKCERTDRVAITVQGEPAPGGSKNAFLHRATGRIVVLPHARRWQGARC
jgi:hypothetical protein